MQARSKTVQDWVLPHRGGPQKKKGKEHTQNTEACEPPACLPTSVPAGGLQAAAGMPRRASGGAPRLAPNGPPPDDSPVLRSGYRDY